MNNQKNPLSRKDEIVVQEIDGEVLIYDLKDNKAFCLNETSALIWQMCDGKNSVSEISKNLGKKLDQPANEDLVWLAIDQLKKEKLIANGEDLVSSLEGMNRREVIKKVGLASMIALPLISGLVAPSAANAASTGQFVGNATISGTGSTSCGGTTAAQNARNGACQTQQGPNCPSGNAVRQPGVCNYDAGTDTSTFGCVCA